MNSFLDVDVNLFLDVDVKFHVVKISPLYAMSYYYRGKHIDRAEERESVPKLEIWIKRSKKYSRYSSAEKAAERQVCFRKLQMHQLRGNCIIAARAKLDFHTRRTVTYTSLTPCRMGVPFTMVLLSVR